MPDSSSPAGTHPASRALAGDLRKWSASLLAYSAPRPPSLSRLTRELAVQTLTNPAPGIWIFDFGQTRPAFCRLRVNAPAGARIQLRFGEELNLDGTLYTANYRSARATDVYYCKGGGEEVWQPRFTYRGFRYAELTGYEGAPDEKTLVACSVHSAVPEVGQFECSSDLINRIWLATLWGQRSNMHSVVTDCPQRDERLGWMGDGQLFARPPAGIWRWPGSSPSGSLI